MPGIESDDWKRDCLHWRGRVLVGERSHWCLNWDNLPIDETCPEWPCGCVFSEDGSDDDPTV